MVKGKQAFEVKRRIPRQARAGETVALILEATAQILEAGGLAAFTTNAVAERAGVSIGTPPSPTSAATARPSLRSPPSSRATPERTPKGPHDHPP